jgi:hypothetical protein
MSNITEQMVNLVGELQKALSAQLQLNELMRKRIEELENHAVMTGDAVLKLIKDQHGADKCGRHCACKAGEM